MRDKVEAVLSRIRPGLGGTQVSLVDINQGVVKVEIFIPICGSVVSKELVVELLEEELPTAMPEFKELVVIE
ncbi:NifU family protein [Chloroflexota bacterium]